MEIVKKNILSILCGVVALIALIALAWPIGGMYDDTRAVLNTRKAVYENLEHLRVAPRSWPVIPGEKTSLRHFPTDPIIEKGNEIKKAVHAQAVEMKTRTQGKNRHELLVRDILPSPGEKRFDFQTAYVKMVKETIPAELNGKQPPTDEDVHKAADALWAKDYEPKILKVGGNEVNADQTVAEWKAECAKLQSKLRNQRALECKLYLEPDAINATRTMPTPAGPKETEIWYAQIMLWVQQDVAAAIERVNKDSKNVIDSPIKHLFRLEVKDDPSMYLNGGKGEGSTGGGASAPGTDFSSSPTGRVSNPVYDVIQFHLVMNVDARKIP